VEQARSNVIRSELRTFGSANTGNLGRLLGGGGGGDDGNNNNNNDRAKILKQQEADEQAYGGRSIKKIYKFMVELDHTVENTPRASFFERIKRGICNFAQGISDRF
jgi:hypothetical protein